MLKQKKGQEIFGISYGVIFSIFVVAFIIAVAFFAIRHFMSLNDCTQIGLFYNDFKGEVERAWTSGKYNDYYNGSLSVGGFFSGEKIEKVCFGGLNELAGTFLTEQDVLKERAVGTNDEDKNVFLYPPDSACGGELYSFDLKCGSRNSNCFETTNFFCVDVKSGKVGVKLRKDVTENQVFALEN